MAAVLYKSLETLFAQQNFLVGRHAFTIPSQAIAFYGQHVQLK